MVLVIFKARGTDFLRSGIGQLGRGIGEFGGFSEIWEILRPAGDFWRAQSRPGLEILENFGNFWKIMGILEILEIPGIFLSKMKKIEEVWARREPGGSPKPWIFLIFIDFIDFLDFLEFREAPRQFAWKKDAFPFYNN